MQTTEGEKNLNPQSVFKATSLESVATPNPEAAVVYNNDFASAGETDAVWDDEETRKAPPNTPLGITIIAAGAGD